jgi:hypothetical protein
MFNFPNHANNFGQSSSENSTMDAAGGMRNLSGATSTKAQADPKSHHATDGEGGSQQEDVSASSDDGSQQGGCVTATSSCGLRILYNSDCLRIVCRNKFCTCITRTCNSPQDTPTRRHSQRKGIHRWNSRMVVLHRLENLVI